MDLAYINKQIPEAITKKDNFGGDYCFIPHEVLTKRKAWNLLIKRGFIICPNKRYLFKDGIYIFNNSLLPSLSITMQ